MYGYIYLTYNKANGRIYIGQRRGKYDDSYFGSGKLILKSISKYGIENFENYVIQWCKSEDELNEMEIYWIAKYNSFYNTGIGYNLARGGNQVSPLHAYTNEQLNSYRKKLKNALNKPETKKKLSESHKGLTNRKGIPFSDESKEKIGKAISKRCKIVYKGETYVADSRTKMEKLFKDKFGLYIKNWFYGQIPKREKDNVNFIGYI